MGTATNTVVDIQRHPVAEIAIQSVEDGWFYGRLVNDAMPQEVRRDLDWYDEVVSGQMLSFLDDALAAVDRHQLSVCLPDETCHRVYSLHIDKSGDSTFRITPVPPPDPSHVEVSSLLS